MKDIYYRPENLQQPTLAAMANHIKEDRTAEDLLFQVMLSWGLPLSLPIKTREIDGKTVFYVASNSLIACFDDLTPALVNTIAQDKPIRFVSSENAITHDADKTNFKERFKQLSPETEVKFI
ncbi:hypothetical protein [Pelistega indica]|uniref:hypothetical protein n=1 Tax=Pelistega indica TaxID=1414851 RepID=UPI0003F7DBCB|nr:hypothetical protein [Pelistega indica]